MQPASALVGCGCICSLLFRRSFFYCWHDRDTLADDRQVASLVMKK